MESAAGGGGHEQQQSTGSSSSSMKAHDGDDQLAPEAGGGSYRQPAPPGEPEGAWAMGAPPAPSNSAEMPALTPGVGPAWAGGSPAEMTAQSRLSRGAAPNKRMPRDPLTNLRICWEFVKGVCARPPGSCRYAHVMMPQRPPGAGAAFAPIPSFGAAGVGPGEPSLPSSLLHHQQQLALSSERPEAGAGTLGGEGDEGGAFREYLLPHLRKSTMPVDEATQKRVCFYFNVMRTGCLKSAAECPFAHVYVEGALDARKAAGAQISPPGEGDGQGVAPSTGGPSSSKHKSSAGQPQAGSASRSRPRAAHAAVAYHHSQLHEGSAPPHHLRRELGMSAHGPPGPAPWHYAPGPPPPPRPPLLATYYLDGSYGDGAGMAAAPAGYHPGQLPSMYEYGGGAYGTPPPPPMYGGDGQGESGPSRTYVHMPRTASGQRVCYYFNVGGSCTNRVCPFAHVLVDMSSLRPSA